MIWKLVITHFVCAVVSGAIATLAMAYCSISGTASRAEEIADRCARCPYANDNSDCPAVYTYCWADRKDTIS